MPDHSMLGSRPEAPTPGQVYGGYRIQRLLGRGGMGAVYEAEAIEDGRLVALKILAEGLDDAVARRRFLREGRLAATLNHPNTVYIYGTEEVDGTPIIAMELVAGGTLEQKVEAGGPLPIPEAIEVSLQIIDGLAAAHAHGILHRDIKPSNCFVGLDGAVKVGDFGLSKSVAGGKESTITRTGLFMGTPAYSSPEQLLGEPLDVRSDIYSVGGTLYYLLTARLPFEGAAAMNVMAAVLQGDPASPRKHRPDIPEPLAAIVLRCLERKPTDRYADYAALRADLEPLRKASVVPASVRARFGALAIDLAGLVPVGLPLVLIPGVPQLLDRHDLAASLAGSFLMLFCLLLWKAIPEGLWGASPGKALLGLKVERGDGARLGMARSVGRNLLLGLPLPVTDLVLAAVGRVESENLGMGAYTVLCLGLLSTMRRTNGFAGLHDLIVGTRVIRVSQATGERRLVQRPAVERTVPEGAQRLGPFALIGPVATLSDASELTLAVDPALRRAVWIHRYPAPRPPLPAERRNLARQGRLRWVAGRRTPAENWDAYEAPDGHPLMAGDVAPVSWETCRARMVDLAAELAALEVTGEPVILGLDRIWITGGERTMILDFPMGPAATGAVVQDPGVLLERVARHSLSTPAQRQAQRWPVLPLSVRSMLDDLPKLTRRELWSARLREVEAVPSTVSRRKRGLAMALMGLPAVVCAILGLSWVRVAAITDPELVRLTPLLEYLQDRPSRVSDSAFAVNRRTIGIYLASRHRDFLGDSTRRNGIAGSAIRWAVVDSALSRYRSFSAEESRLAAHTVEFEWERNAQGPFRRPKRGPIYGIALGVGGLLLTGILSLGAALLFRTGAAFRAAGIDLVTSSGRQTGRPRLLLRTLLVWLPILGPIAILALPRMNYRVGHVIGTWVRHGSTSDPAGTALAGIIVLLAVLGIVSLVVSLRTPARGLADRIVGTYLVPR